MSLATTIAIQAVNGNLQRTVSGLWAKYAPITVFQKMLFFDHLRVMTKGGLSLVESLNVLGRETGNKRLQKHILEVKKIVEEGAQLSDALAKFPKIFDPIYTRMIAAGEVGGRLEHALEQTVTQLRKSYELTSTVRGAMIYPSVIVFAMGGIGVMMVTFVFPQLTSLFSEFNTELPLATRILIAVTDLFSTLLFLIFAPLITIGLGIAHFSSLRRSPGYREKMHSLILKTPILGGISRQLNLARFSLTLSSLMQSAVPIVDAIEITGSTCPNVHYRNALTTTAELVRKGTPISQGLAHYPTLFPPIVTEMVMVGEQSGDVQSLLNELAIFYNDEVVKTMKNFTSIIEPVIILVIGSVVGVMAVGVIMPMYTLVQNF